MLKMLMLRKMLTSIIFQFFTEDVEDVDDGPGQEVDEDIEDVDDVDDIILIRRWMKMLMMVLVRRWTKMPSSKSRKVRKQSAQDSVDQASGWPGHLSNYILNPPTTTII